MVDGSGVNMKVYKKIGIVSGEQASFVFTGRLLRDKGVAEYIKAANILKEKYGKPLSCRLARR